ncbi:PAS domain-containing methyl-accepting chemotaxis protein [Asticcacaulis sp. ZE23SCel15]|uniref:methyl-accepting chemotaxis protein n=1 Tax=Asticcacaulis sp. ZE23SCel15 TaxID=3059027 RepID=UPI00265E0339|nr:PAS domain-containing methyl-accepting chemotaxis protein [Asticcacaulis sp. ZE23SCel15]WKL58346.1 PAS domain-containing methyl-accepting chemotaxis protein [Asticcacaulis sp. ZE23SCel15]
MFKGFTKSSLREDQAVIAALNASQAVIEFTPDGHILDANTNFLQTVGYDLSEIKGRHHSLFCDVAYVETEDYRRFWRDLGNGVFASNEYKRFGKGGRVIWLQATYNPIRDERGNVVKVIKFASDITDAKLKELDYKGKMAAIGRVQAVIEFTTDGTILTANDNFLKTLGYTLKDIEGQHHRMFCDLAYTQSADYRTFWQNLAQGEFQAGEFRRLKRDGSDVFIQAAYNPIFDDAGAVVKIVKFATDISDVVRKRLRNESLNQNLSGVIEQILICNSMAGSASHASHETGAIINSVAAASEELSQSVREISHAMTSAKVSVEGVFDHTAHANTSAGTLNNSATAMNNVVSIIQDIAGQINLLALNATIESARAGEAGRGFAVVASEVKSLANQAARSTQTIAAEIANMQAVTNEVVDALGLITQSMTGVLENVSSVASAIEQQNAATGEISHNMQTAVGAVGQINDSLSTISETFTQVADASAKVKSEMETLVA